MEHRGLIIGVVAAATAVLLIVAGCVAGILMAPRVVDVLQPMAESRTEATAQPPLAREDVQPEPENTPIFVPPPAPAATPTAIPADILSEADAEERRVADVYERVAPSVVHIRVVQHVSGADLPRFEVPGWPDEFYRRGQGSGFIWDRDGHVVTNYHVVH